MPKTEVIEYGPFTDGYVCSVPKHMAGPKAITGDSREAFIDPLTGGVMRRPGMNILGDTYASHEVTGLLDAAWGARSRRAFPMRSPSLTDGYPTYASLWTRDDPPNGGTYPTQEDGYFGTVLVRNTNAGAALANYRIYDEFSATHYPTKSGAAGSANFYNQVHHMIGIPLWKESGEGGYTRGAFAFDRRFLAGGSRSVLDAGGPYPKMYLPNLRCTPAWWGKQFNDATTTGTQINRLQPAGPTPPVAAPIVGGAVASGGTLPDSGWVKGDTFGAAVMYRKKDGSYTAPTAIQLPNANNPDGSGVVVVGNGYGATQYTSITWAVAVGPDDVDARILLRTKKNNRTVATQALGFDPFTLFICGIMKNNSQTEFIDTNGNDLGLFQDPAILRTDHTQPRRGRYWGTGDQRGLMGYTLPGQQSFVVCPMGITANWGVVADGNSVGLNGPDTSAIIYTGNVMLVRITTSQFQISRFDAAASTLVTTSYNLAGITIQDLIDKINNTQVNVPAVQGQWRAQLCPGADGLAPALSLCPTTWIPTAHGTNGDNFITADVVGDFASIPLGYKITGSASIPANTIALRKDGDKLYLGDESGAAVTLTGNIAALTPITFAADCGDGVAYHATLRGFIRVYGPSYFMYSYLKRSAIPGFNLPDIHTTFFTISSPGAAASGVSLAPESFVAGNRRSESRIGIHMGFVDIEGAAAIGYSNGLRVFMNVGDFNAGDDRNYRLLTVEDAGGVTDDKAFVGGRGWAVYGNDEGIFAIDKDRKPKRLSERIHNYDRQEFSSIAFELQACRDAVESGKDTGCLHLAVTGPVIHLTYRISNVSFAEQRQTYHFAPGVEAAGVAELFDPATGKPYAWGAPCVQPLSCITEVSTALGRYRIATIDTNHGVADGRIDRIDIPGETQDNGADYDPIAYLSCRRAGWFTQISALRVETEHVSPTGATPTLRWYRTLDRSSYSDMVPIRIGEDPAREILELGLEARTNGVCAEPAWLFSDTDGEGLYGLAAEVALARG